MKNLVIVNLILVLLPIGCWTQDSWLNPLEKDPHTLFICHWDNANDATLKSATGIEVVDKLPTNPKYVAGKFDQGLNFSPNSSLLQYPIKSNLNFHSGTIEFWFKPTTPDWSDRTHHFFLAPTGWADGWKNKIEFTFHCNHLRVLIGDKDGKIQFCEIPDIFLKTGEWYHLGFSWKTNQGTGNDAVKIFCNGETIGYWTGLTINLDDISAGNFMLGNEEGIIDEFRISDNWREYQQIKNSKSFLETNVLSIYLSKDWDWEAELTRARTMAVPAVSGRIINVSGQSAPGGDGSETHPFATISEAVKKAQAGDRLLIKGGVYRESIPIKNGLQIFAKEGEEVILNGACVVTGWKFDQALDSYAADEINLEYNFVERNWSSLNLTGEADIATPANRNPNSPDIAFCDGKLLERCDNPADLKEKDNAFFWDRAKKRIYVRLAQKENPSGHLMEVGVKLTAFEGSGDNVVLHGLTVTHYANPVYGEGSISHGAITISGNNWLVENCNALFNASAGIVLFGNGNSCNNNVVRNCQSNYNGWLGFFANWGTFRNTIIDSETSYNNWKFVNPNLGAGGMKFCSANNYIVSGCIANENYGPGIWFDGNCRNTVITNNITCANKAHAGIMYEISYSGLIRNNFCSFNNTNFYSDYPDLRDPRLGGGVFLSQTAGCVVEDNVFVGNQNGLVILQRNRTKSSSISVLDNVYTNYWFTYENLIRKNSFMDNKNNAIAIWETSNSRPTFDDFKNISRENFFISKQDDVKISWNEITTLKTAQKRGYEQGSKLIKLEEDNANYVNPTIYKKFVDLNLEPLSPATDPKSAKKVVEPLAVDLGPEGEILDWLVLGAFPHPPVIKADGSAVLGLGYAFDFLSGLGGEANIKPRTGDSVEVKFPGGPDAKSFWMDEQLKQRRIAWQRVHAAVVDVRPLLGTGEATDNTCVYAFCILRVAKEMQALLKLGSDDGYVLFVNGRKIGEVQNDSRSCSRDANVHEVMLRSGENVVVFKVCNAKGAFALGMRVTDPNGQPAKGVRVILP